MTNMRASDFMRPGGLSPFWKSLASPARARLKPESPERILNRLGLSNIEQVPKAANWRQLIDRNAGTPEEIAVAVAKLIRIWLLGLTPMEWDILVGISEAERNEPAMTQKHHAVKERLASFVQRWDPAPAAQMSERFEEVQRRIDAFSARARDARCNPATPPT